MSWSKKIALIIVMVLTAFGAYHFLGKTPPSSLKKSSKNITSAIAVKQTFIGKEKSNNKLKAIGTGRALYTVNLMSRASGILQKIYVRSGAYVKKNALLAQLDNQKEEIDLKKARLVYEDSQKTVKRFETLRASNAVSNVQFVQSQLALQNAKLALDAAQLAFNQRKILSPIDGIVGIFAVDQGNYITPNNIIVRIDNLSQILIDFWVPERFVPFINKGDGVDVKLVTNPDKFYRASIVAIDNMVDDKSRTMHIRAALDNSSDKLRAGMSFEVILNFLGAEHLAIDPLAIHWRDGKPYVWKIAKGVAQEVAVNILQRTQSYLLIKGALKKGDALILEASQTILPGSLIKVNDTILAKKHPK